MANVICCGLSVINCQSYKAFLKTLPRRILGDFFMITIIYFYMYYF